jgi:hypothetical protein
MRIAPSPVPLMFHSRLHVRNFVFSAVNFEQAIVLFDRQKSPQVCRPAFLDRRRPRT